MKISELPQAAEITGEEILPVVQNGETKKVSRDNLVGIVPDGLTVENGKMFLVSNGEKVDEGAPLPQIPVDSELSAESTNPVQNGTVTAALNSKISDENGSVHSNHLASGSVTSGKLAQGAVRTDNIANGCISESKLSTELQNKLNNPKSINKIMLDESTQGAVGIKVNKDSDGNTFRLNEAVITAHLNIDVSEKVGTQYQIRVVANGGRILFYQTGLVIRPYADVVVKSSYDHETGITFNIGAFTWTVDESVSTGSTPNTMHPGICNTPSGNTAIQDIEVFVTDLGNNQRMPLLSGSFLHVRGSRI